MRKQQELFFMMNKTENILCIIPVFNDWESCAELLTEIAKLPLSCQIVLVNDGSTERFFTNDLQQNLPKNLPITCLDLTINVGHQRAIAIGLAHIKDNFDDVNYVIVMDCDGEDRPQDIPLLIKKTQEEKNRKIIFAQRQRRTEGVLFKTFYVFYKVLFRILTGQRLNFGNFSCIPIAFLTKVIAQPALWNHYSGSIIKSKLPYSMIPLDRGKRYHGQSKMNIVSLIVHGLSAIAIYIEIVTVRLLLFSLAGIGLSLLAILTVFIVKIFTPLAIPGWASNISLLIFNIIIQFTVVSLLILLLILYNRNTVQPSPNRFYKDFINTIEKY
jgi:polyisoprenyl-phosphate glycosyltransferase